MDSNPVANIPFGLSVVIATLGGHSIEKTINSLVSSSLVPDEILLCIPQEYSHKVIHLANHPVKIIETDVKGQVAQRAIGFSKAVFELVLQVDDDIFFKKETLSTLAHYLFKLGPGNVIGPVYYGLSTGKCIHETKIGLPAVTKNLFDYIFCAAPWGLKKMGVVTSIGINYGVDDKYCTSELVNAQWLPGGCVLSFKEDLILENFFPFTGKAYCEDIYHSHYRAQAKTKSWVATGVCVFIEEPEPEFSRQAVDKVIAIRRYYLKLIRGPQWRLFFYEMFCRIRSRLYSAN